MVLRGLALPKEVWLEYVQPTLKGFAIVQSKSPVWLCDSMDCYMPGFPVLQYLLLEFGQIHVHWVGDAA